jgi:hypothetical protein
MIFSPPLVEVNENFVVSIWLSRLSYVYPTHFLKSVVLA